MSIIKICDVNECHKTDENSVIFEIDYKYQKYLKEQLYTLFSYNPTHICEECIEKINYEYKNMLVFNDVDDVVVSKEYIPKI